MRFLATCFLSAGLALGAQTYEQDAQHARAAYAEQKTETTRLRYYVLAPKNDLLIIVSNGGWTMDATDQLMEQDRYTWRRLGFRRVGFMEPNPYRNKPMFTLHIGKNQTRHFLIYRDEAL